MAFGDIEELKIACIGPLDMIFGEDAALLSKYNAATNWSIIRNITINIARMSSYDSLAKVNNLGREQEWRISPIAHR